MLFSRSGVINSEYNPKGSKNNQNILGKYMGSKPNAAILPQFIYDSPAKIELRKEMLIRILNIENRIRLSNEAKDLCDKNKNKGLKTQLMLDKQMIKTALQSFGFSPDDDDSLKAYHLATTKFIDDEEVRNSVVWMKYDKCKIGKHTVNDYLKFDDIKYMI